VERATRLELATLSLEG